MDRPLLLIDIDGVVSLFGFDRRAPPAGRFVSVDGIVHFLSAVATEQLIELQAEFELVWCSGWEEKADEYLPFALGLPAGLPHIGFEGQSGSDGRHWKLTAIDRYAGERRALAWIDDVHDESCHAWAAGRPGPTLLVGTDPAAGLTARHASELFTWARGLGEAQRG
jgi:HAD domain in Swiss Army Knife RNA repair proteins